MFCEKPNKLGRKKGKIMDKISLEYVLFWELSTKILEEWSP